MNIKLPKIGQTAIEYMVLLALAAIVVLVSFKTFLPATQSVGEGYFNKISTKIWGGCPSDPNPCQRQNVECGQVRDLCSNTVECDYFCTQKGEFYTCIGQICDCLAIPCSSVCAGKLCGSFSDNCESCDCRFNCAKLGGMCTSSGNCIILPPI